MADGLIELNTVDEVFDQAVPDIDTDDLFLPSTWPAPNAVS